MPPENISDIVVNAAMNRGRGFAGVNSYTRDLRQFDIGAFLQERVKAHPSRTVRWLDACCGEGRALWEASQLWNDALWSRHLEIIGLDLWDDLPPSRVCADGPTLRFIGADIDAWTPPDAPLALITCVHGLHYLPDKLSFLERAYSWLAPDGGLLLAHLDTANVREEGNETSDLWATLARRARKQGVTLRLSNHLLRLERTPGSPDALTFGCTFAGRTVSPKPNFSGMTVIDSWYRGEQSA